SSSTTSSPSRLKRTSRWSRRCVPTTMSTWPLLSPSTVRACVSSSTNRDSISTTTGKFFNRSRNTWKCCCASTVVGASSATCFPHRVHLQQLVGDVLHALAGTPSRTRPIGRPEPVQCRSRLAAEVFLHAIEVFDRHEQPVTFGVLELEVLPVRTFRLDQAHPLESRDPMVDVDDELVRCEVQRELARHVLGASAGDAPATRGPAHAAKQL